MSFYLDTNICIFILRGKNERVLKKVNATNSDDIKIPSVVKAELFAGAFKSAAPEKNIKQIQDFLNQFEIIPFDDLATWTYGRIWAELERKGQRIGSNDLIIAATVLSRNGTLITNNVKEFSRIDGLIYSDWTQS